MRSCISEQDDETFKILHQNECYVMIRLELNSGLMEQNSEMSSCDARGDDNS